LQDEFHLHRDHLVGKLQKGNRGFSPKEYKVHSVVKRKKYVEELLPPPKTLLPWEDYQLLYEVKLMKKAGHKIQVIKGKRMVAMPPPPGTAWLLQQRFSDEVEKNETVDSGNESGCSEGDDPVGGKFQDLVSKADEKVQQSAKGMSMAELLHLASTSGGGQPKKARKAKAKAGPVKRLVWDDLVASDGESPVVKRTKRGAASSSALGFEPLAGAPSAINDFAQLPHTVIRTTVGLARQYIFNSCSQALRTSHCAASSFAHFSFQNVKFEERCELEVAVVHIHALNIVLLAMGRGGQYQL
jgi:hypothetical protein